MGTCREKLQSLLNSARDLIQIIALDGSILYTNPAWRQALSYSEAEVKHLSFFDLVHPASREHCQKAFTSVQSRKDCCSIEVSLMAKDGRIIGVEGQISYQIEPGRSPEIWSIWHHKTEDQSVAAMPLADRVMGSHLDSDRPLSAMDETVYPLEDIVRSVSGETFDFIYLNPSAEKIYGIPNSEFFNNSKLWWDVIHPQDRDRVQAATQKLLKTGSQDIEYRIVRPDGTMRWIRDRSWTICDINGSTIRIDSIATDITKSKQIEQQLNWSWRFLHKILNAIADPIFVKDENHCWVIVNNAFCQLIGHNREELIGKSDYEFFPQEEADIFWEKDEQVFRTGIENENEEYFTDGRGDIHLISTKKSILEDSKDSKLLVGTIRDLTERKRVESEITIALAKERELNQLKSSFVSLVSHEFRTPLTTIQSSIDILEHFPCNETEKQELFSQIKEAIAQIVQLMEDVLFIGNRATEKIKVDPRWFDVASLCKTLVKELETSTRRQYELVFYPQESIYNHLCLDENLLREILSHLLSNAIKYSSLESSVKLELVYKDREITFKVQDRGVGIPQEDRQRLFELFHRASNVGTISGKGLGLAIVKHCVDLHGGKIAVDSEVGQGTTFTVTLPLKQEEVNSENNFSD